MSKKPPNYKQIEIRKWRQNARNVASELDNEDENLMKRINSYVHRFGYEQDSVEDEIRDNEMFAAHFAKAPSREGFHEKEAAKWLKNQLKMEIEILPKGGKNAIYVSRDGIIAPIAPEEKKPSKSLDFRWTHDGITFFAMHKYTHESGGSQGSAHKEMREVLMNFQPASNKSKVLIIIVDGEFYTDARMEELQNLTRESDPKSFAVHIEDVPKVMKKY